MFDYFRIACAVPDVEVADTDFNTEQIVEFIDLACKRNVDLISFPELCVTGCTCGDLFMQKTLLDAAKDSVINIAKATENEDILAVIGAPLELGNAVYNCAVMLHGGRIKGIVPKTYVGTDRHFVSGAALDIGSVNSKSLGFDEEYEIPVGSLIFDCSGVKIGAEISDDISAPVAPSSVLCLAGAQIITNISAVKRTVGKISAVKELIKNNSANNLCVYSLCSAGCNESTTDSVYSGYSAICENGSISAELEEAISSDYMIVADVDLERIDYDRKKSPIFNSCKSLYTAECAEYVSIEKGESKSNGEYAKIRKLPFIPSNEKERIKRCLEIFEIQVAGLKKRLAKTGSKPVIGISGGLDSTLALLVSVKAVKELGRPLTDVIGITMPCFGTTDRTYNNALSLMNALGITSLEINIKEACLQHFEDIGQSINNYDATYENAQARERTQVLMDYAGRSNGIVIGTGDLSELALGWCTYNGDHMSMYAVNSNVPKTLIRWIIDSLIKHSVFVDGTDCLRDILDTPISPELLPPDADGKIAQQTESIVGPYALHDFFLYYHLRYGFAPEKVFALAVKAFANDFDGETILKWLKTFYRRFFTQQFKRNCVPDGVMLGSVGLSPKNEWVMPSDASSAMWLKRLDKINPADFGVK